MGERINNMNDLEFGDILILRNTQKYVYADNCMYGYMSGYYHDADDVYCCYTDFNDDEDSECDIIQVIRNGKTIYERTVKEMTLKEVCKELGYEVKIIKED